MARRKEAGLEAGAGGPQGGPTSMSPTVGWSRLTELLGLRSFTKRGR